MRRIALAAALLGAATLAAAAPAAVAPGAYKGKIAGSPVTVAVAGSKVTITAAKFPIKCLGPSGQYDAPSDPMKYEFKGTLVGNKLSGTYRSPVGGAGELFIAKGVFSPATKSFAGTLSFQGHCRGTSAVTAKKG